MGAELEPRDICEILFVGRDGEREYLWCERLTSTHCEVRTPPMFICNISVGTVIEASETVDEGLAYGRTVRPLPGVTLRFFTSDDADASRVYDDEIIDFARDAGIAIGPASMVGKKSVSFHVHRRDPESEKILDCLEALARNAVIKDWEIGDPAPTGDRVGADLGRTVIRHEKPTT